MKKSIKAFMIMGVLLIAAACNRLDLEPTGSLPIDTAIQSVKDVNTGLVGAYDWLQRFTDRSLIVFPELMAGNAAYLGNNFYTLEIFRLTMSAFNPQILNTWTSGYGLINQANLILDALETLDDPALTPELAAQFRGEALFLRGLLHWELVRLFALPYGPQSGNDPGVPLMLSPTATTDDLRFSARASVAEVYDQVIADLTEAAELLPGFISRGRVHRFVALGYLARVAFQQNDYQRAADLAAEVMDGPFALTPDPEIFFREEGSGEEIWSVVYTPQDYGSLPVYFHPDASPCFIAAELVEEGYRQIITSDQWDAIHQAGVTADDRRVSTLTALDTTKVFKYEDIALWADDAPLLRLAEILLLRAEALARIEGVNQESIDLLNQVRQRAIRVKDAGGELPPDWEAYISFDPKDFATADELIETIIRERRVELAFEGNYFHDLMRLRRPVQGLPYDDNRLRWPIPQREIDVNSNLEQNPGY